jgi:hypothetical protein
MWKQISLPYIFERMIGFAVTNEKVIILSYEGIHSLDLLSSNHEISNDFDNPEGGNLYDYQKNALRYQNQDYLLCGQYGGNSPKLSTRGESLILNRQEETIIIGTVSEEHFKFKYQDLSGDWAFATFTPDDKFVVLGLPYDIYIFERV